jgi:Tfp pilus assembly protein PilX
MPNEHERGYALVMVLFMILLLTILGTAVVSSTLGGATRSETRENDVQSLHLAEKTLNEAASYLVTEFDGREDIAPEELSFLMQKVDDLTRKTTNTSLPDASGRISEISTEQVSVGDQTSYNVNLTAEAEVNHVKRRLTQQITIAAYPDFLNYAFGSENDVIINGAAYGLGNIYAGHEFLIDNHAKYIYDNDPDKKKETKYPYFDGNIFIQNMDSIKVLDKISGQYQPYSRTNLTLQQLLGVENSQIQLRDQKKFISINVAESFIDKAEEATNADRNSIKAAVDYAVDPAHSGETGRFNSLLAVLKSGSGVTFTSGPPSKPTLPTDLDDEELMDAYNKALADYEAYFVQFNSLSSTVLFNGNLTLDGVDYKSLVYTDSAKKTNHKWLIVNGDLTISNYSSDPLIVKANILVTGNVFISDTVKVDSTIFTLGKTTIEDAQIQGIQSDGERQQLILISKGPVLVNRVDSFTNFGKYDPSKPNILDAFFYTDEDAELYGVGSIFWLRGGFFSKGDLTINAVLGNASAGDSDILFDPRPQASLAKEDSRFIINYDYDFFKNQYEGLPRVKKISVIVGKKQLVSSSDK